MELWFYVVLSVGALVVDVKRLDPLAGTVNTWEIDDFIDLWTLQVVKT